MKAQKKREKKKKQKQKKEAASAVSAVTGGLPDSPTLTGISHFQFNAGQQQADSSNMSLSAVDRPPAQKDCVSAGNGKQTAAVVQKHR